MTQPLNYHIATTPFDEQYTPSPHSRITTNFANLARGPHREQNLRDVLAMINGRFNDLAHWDNPTRDRYTVEIDIVSVTPELAGDSGDLDVPLIEMLNVSSIDHHTGVRRSGIVGNNFSSYIRDYDFSVVLPEHVASGAALPEPPDFGELHGTLFAQFIHSDTYAAHFSAPPVICISVSSSASYQQLANTHPILGTEFQQDQPSLTDRYFEKMGLRVRHFMPIGSVAPLAFYSTGDLLNDYTNLELIGTISTMEAFQKIYRPEIYNAHSAAAHTYRPSLRHRDFSRVHISYDRDERTQLGTQQGVFAAHHLMQPVRDTLQQRLTPTRQPARSETEQPA